MNTNVVTDRQEAPVSSIMVREEKLVVTMSASNRGRLPMRAAELQPEGGDYSPPFNQRYTSR